MLDRIERYNVERSIEDVMEMIDASPMRRDLVPSFNSVQVANRAHNAHLAIEHGLKTLTVHAGGPLVESHALLKLLNQLVKSDPCTAEFLVKAFGDAVEFYGYNVNAQKFNHFRSLRDYLAKVGGDNAFNLYRYWTLDDIGKSHHDIPPISLPVHRELLQALALLVGPEIRRTVSERVDQAIFHAMTDLSRLIYSDSDPDRAAAVHDYLEWFKEQYRQRRPFRSMIEDAVANNFEVGISGLATDFLRHAFEALKKSEDPAVKYFVAKLSYLARGSQQRIPGIYPEVEWIDENETNGLVLTAAGSILGRVQKYADGGWGVEPSENGLAQIVAVAWTLTDAKLFLVHRLTRQLELGIGDDKKVLRIVSDTDHLYSLRDVEWTGDAVVGPETYELEFWDDAHGLQPSDSISAKLRRRGRSDVVSVLEGDITSVDKQNVSVIGTSWLDLDKN